MMLLSLAFALFLDQGLFFLEPFHHSFLESFFVFGLQFRPQVGIVVESLEKHKFDSVSVADVALGRAGEDAAFLDRR